MLSTQSYITSPKRQPITVTIGTHNRLHSKRDKMIINKEPQRMKTPTLVNMTIIFWSNLLVQIMIMRS